VVGADGTLGITDASATQRPSTPCTAPRASTTAPASGSGPIAQVADRMVVRADAARIDRAIASVSSSATAAPVPAPGR
jgi:hypothetical protein